MTNQTTPRKDTLLTAGKLLTVFLQIVVALAMAALAVALLYVLLNPGEVATALAENGSDASVALILTIISVTVVAAIAVIAAAYHFFQLLGQIIDTVSDGEPFVAINAERLHRMGWIALLFQLASFPIGAMAGYLVAQFPLQDITADVEFSLTGVLLALVLFILARVFRHGTEMRDDLEGTV